MKDLITLFNTYPEGSFLFLCLLWICLHYSFNLITLVTDYAGRLRTSKRVDLKKITYQINSR